MQSEKNVQLRLYLFIGILLLCVLAATYYVVTAATRSTSVGVVQSVDAPAAEAPLPALASPLQAAASLTSAQDRNRRPADRGNVEGADALLSPLPLPLQPIADLPLTRIITQPFLISVNAEQAPAFRRVQVAALNQLDSTEVITDLRCQRVYFASGRGICLLEAVDGLAINTQVTLFDDKFQPQLSFLTEGYPSRARISPDGRYAAFTVFLAGHSYDDISFATGTTLLDAKTGESLGNLEAFTVYQDGKVIDFPEFNYWGVTFSQESNTFYATLHFNGTPHLVRGDIADRSVAVVLPGVECPSLSPDETRVAFKKNTAHGWRLTVLELDTLTEMPLAETRVVDDQVEWLDNDHILYEQTHMTHGIYMVPADGSGEPRLFLAGAVSPAVIRLADEAITQLP